MGMLVLYCGAVRGERANKRHPVSSFLNQNGLTGLERVAADGYHTDGVLSVWQTAHIERCASGELRAAFVIPAEWRAGLGNRPHIRPDS